MSAIDVDTEILDLNLGEADRLVAEPVPAEDSMRVSVQGVAVAECLQDWMF